MYHAMFPSLARIQVNTDSRHRHTLDTHTHRIKPLTCLSISEVGKDQQKHA